MEPAPIGFEMQNESGGASVSPAPMQYPNVQVQDPPPPAQPDPALYPPLSDPQEDRNGYQQPYSNPIGFEMQEQAPQDGPTEVVSEKFPIEMKGDTAVNTDVGDKNEEEKRETEAMLLDVNDPSRGVKVRTGSVVSGDNSEEETMFFTDGVRRIDYVLAYEPDKTANAENRRSKREYFENELQKEGLQLEYEPIERSKSGKVAFVKVHAPWGVLAKHAELMNMKMPLHPNDLKLDGDGFFDCIPTPFDLDPDLIEEDDNYFTAPFNRSRMDQFVIKDKETFFTNAQRSRIVYSILARLFYEDAKPDDPGARRFGIKKLLSNGSYSAAFPLHDGKFLSEHSLLTRGKMNDRHLLYELWARPKMWYKYQPLDKIRKYFGEKVGIYFAWLGYYTMMLIPASIVGLAAFIYGCATVFSSEVLDDLCNGAAANITMCPLCDKKCPYWKLGEKCNSARATYLFDNPATVAFAIFMALWASFFHELWKRKQAEIGYDWDVAEFEDEEETVRPEYEARVRRKKVNPITKKEEPFLPSWSKCVRFFTTITIILFFLCIVVAAVFGVIIYRIVMSGLLAANSSTTISGRSSLIASATAACINLVIIFFLNFIYQRIALALTELERPRTESEWEDAFTFKMYLFQCVNFYATMLYIAFIKGRFVGRPGKYDYNLFGYRQEECDPAGCIMELCLQLGIIMVGKQIFANFREIVLPKLVVWFKGRSVNADKSDKVYTHWEQDYNLADQPNLGLFDEYLEMVIQYGFITIFVAAFPLAPLFALLNNIVEIRLDAYKFVTQWKRPLALRAQDIGIWFGILQGVSVFAVISNAAIIAFTSDFIPKLVYLYGYSEDGSMRDYYANFSLSVFRVSDFEEKSISEVKTMENVTFCSYRAFRSGYEDDYEFTIVYWHVLASRLAFIVVFENLVVFLTWFIMYLIPDMPYSVKIQMLREKFLSKMALFDAEHLKDLKTE